MCLVPLGYGTQFPPGRKAVCPVHHPVLNPCHSAWHIVGAQQTWADGLLDGPRVSKVLWGLNGCELSCAVTAIVIFISSS